MTKRFLIFCCLISLVACASTEDDLDFFQDVTDTADEVSDSVSDTVADNTSDFNDDINDSLDDSLPPSLALVNPGCDSLEFGDGRGGNLWLDVSAGNGLPVYLINGGWQAQAAVEAQLVSGGFEQGNFTGFANPDGNFGNALRQHFRFSRNCTAYTGTLVVTDASQSCEINVGDSCSRVD